MAVAFPNPVAFSEVSAVSSVEGRVTTKPQPRSKETFHHEGREEHEVRNLNVIISEPFVFFVRFAVT